MRLTGQPIASAALTAAQLGVPVAAAAIGSQSGLLRPGEPAALLLGTLLAIAVAVLSASVAARMAARAGPVNDGPPRHLRPRGTSTARGGRRRVTVSGRGRCRGCRR